MKHYILCRYNIGLYSDNPYKEKNKIKDPNEWMSKRLPMYRRFLASLKAQTNQNFELIAFLDSNTPEELKKEIESVTKEYISNYQIVTLTTDPLVTPANWVQKQNIKEEWLITSRIDNDDAYYPKFVEVIQNAFRKIQEVLDVQGHQLDERTSKRYTSGRVSPTSPFISFVEKSEGDRITCFGITHSTMVFTKGGRFASKEALYIQYIHDHNLMNKIVGTEIK